MNISKLKNIQVNVLDKKAIKGAKRILRGRVIKGDLKNLDWYIKTIKPNGKWAKTMKKLGASEEGIKAFEDLCSKVIAKRSELLAKGQETIKPLLKELKKASKKSEIQKIKAEIQKATEQTAKDIRKAFWDFMKDDTALKNKFVKYMPDHY